MVSLIKRQHDKMRNYGLFFDSFLDLHAIKPYKTISLIEICENAQLDKRTFYRYFDSKDDLLIKYVFFLGDRLVKVILDEPELSNHAVIRLYFTLWREQLPFLNAMQRDGLFNILLSNLDIYFMRSLGDAGVPEPNSEVTPAETALYRNLFFGTALNQILIKWFTDGAIRTPEEIADIFFKPEEPNFLEAFSDKSKIRQLMATGQ